MQLKQLVVASNCVLYCCIYSLWSVKSYSDKHFNEILHIFLMTSTIFYDHFWKLFQNNIGIFIKIKNRLRPESGRRTSGARSLVWVQKVNEVLDNGVVSGVNRRSERKRAFAVTKEGMIAVWCDDPVLKRLYKYE